MEIAVNETNGRYFYDLRDPRWERTRDHELLDILILAICAVIGGADYFLALKENQPLPYADVELLFKDLDCSPKDHITSIMPAALTGHIDGLKNGSAGPSPTLKPSSVYTERNAGRS